MRTRTIVAAGAIALAAGAVAIAGLSWMQPSPPAAASSAVPRATVEVTRGTLRDTKKVTGTLSYGELSALRPGHVIELDQAVGAPIELVLNREIVLARGEVVEVGDEYGVRITRVGSGQAV